MVATAGGTLPKECAALYLTPGVRLTVYPNGLVSVFGSAGGGYARYSESKERVNGSPNPSQRDTNTRLAVWRRRRRARTSIARTPRRSPRCLHRCEEFLDRHAAQPRPQCRGLRGTRAAFLRDPDELDRAGRKASIDKGHQVLYRRVRECRGGVMAISDDQPRDRVTTGRVTYSSTTRCPVDAARPITYPTSKPTP